MPIYATRCQECDADDSIYRLVAERDLNIPQCLMCGGEMKRVVSAPMVITDLVPYQSMIDGRLISSRSQHRAHLKEHGCVEIGNETKYLQPPKKEIGLAPESKAARKQTIIEQVNAIK